MKIKLKSEIAESWLKEKVLLPMLSKKIVLFEDQMKEQKPAIFGQTLNCKF